MRTLDFTRSDRLSDQIKIEISSILRDEVKDPRLEGLTIMKVELSKDIRKAFVFFSPHNSFNNADLREVLEGLEKANGFIRSVLAKRMKIKRLPGIFFEVDKSY